MNFKYHDKRYISVVANGGGGVEVYHVAKMNMELGNTLLDSTPKYFIEAQGKYKMRYEDLAYNNESQYLHILANFQTDFSRNENTGSTFYTSRNLFKNQNTQR